MKRFHRALLASKHAKMVEHRTQPPANANALVTGRGILAKVNIHRSRRTTVSEISIYMQFDQTFFEAQQSLKVL